MISRWFDFDPFESKMKKSAGVIIILNRQKMLFCHPSNSKWFGTYSFPKGGLEKDEAEAARLYRLAPGTEKVRPYS